jgi:hypothetical protein
MCPNRRDSKRSSCFEVRFVRLATGFHLQPEGKRYFDRHFPTVMTISCAANQQSAHILGLNLTEPVFRPRFCLEATWMGDQPAFSPDGRWTSQQGLRTCILGKREALRGGPDAKRRPFLEGSSTISKRPETPAPISLPVANPHFSPASCCGRRCTAPRGVFSLRGARRTVKYDSAPLRSKTSLGTAPRRPRHESW